MHLLQRLERVVGPADQRQAVVGALEMTDDLVANLDLTLDTLSVRTRDGHGNTIGVRDLDCRHVLTRSLHRRDRPLPTTVAEGHLCGAAVEADAVDGRGHAGFRMPLQREVERGADRALGETLRVLEVADVDREPDPGLLAAICHVVLGGVPDVDPAQLTLSSAGFFYNAFDQRRDVGLGSERIAVNPLDVAGATDVVPDLGAGTARGVIAV